MSPRIITQRSKPIHPGNPEWFSARYKGFESTDMWGFGITETAAVGQLQDLWPHPPRRWGPVLFRAWAVAGIGLAVWTAWMVLIMTDMLSWNTIATAITALREFMRAAFIALCLTVFVVNFSVWADIVRSVVVIP